MAYTPPITAAGQVLTNAIWNTYVRDNFAAGVPDIFTVKGDLAVASATDAAGRLAIGSDFTIPHAKQTATLGLEYSSGVFGLVQRVAAQALATATTTKIQPDTTVSDTYSMWDSTNFRFTIPAGFPTRHYNVIATGYFDGHATADKLRYLEILWSGSSVVGRQSTVQDDASTAIGLTVAVGNLSMAVGQYVEINARQNSGGNLNFNDLRFAISMVR